ncbi:HK97-gp10 family putative phage morphogenesis protein [Paenibacillus thailandensis]|uniref:HK97-gp10 family putative phage morphogenesis protein n=1 Tax=Paenibacillus thailandensis TaxID=393250 RepID=A0ABW5QTK9_9BACL
MTVKNLSRLLAKLDALGGDVNQALKIGVAQGAKKVAGDAKMLAPVNDGELRNSINDDVKVEGDKIVGEVYTNAEHAPYVEFGTGPVGMASDKGELPHDVLSKLSYRHNGWWIHESQIDAKTAEKYHFVRRETDDGVFYYTEGQPAQPFLFPAANQNKDIVPKMVAAVIRQKIKGLGGES